MSLLKSSRSVWRITRSQRLPHSTDCSRLSRVEKEPQSDRQLVPLIISPLWLLIMTLKHDISEWSVYMYKHNVAYFLVQLLKPHKLRLVLHYNREISILQRLLSWLLHKWKVQLDIREGFYLSTSFIKTIHPHLKESDDGCNHTHCHMWLHPLSVASPSDSSSSGLCRQQFW